MTLEEVLSLVKQLSLVDKVRLIERVAPEIERDLTATHPAPRRSLWGLCADLGTAPSAATIDQARQEEWASFPRENIS
ncbi:hypothetical protein K9N68_04545 [Kovacikia minuta CCNUW1]|uniref:hypothetical protein n=1 Tax=Kovacikia minuta TaxID=2931930 RepID=UPI001CC9B1DF|nr:hypothetical protein [Kovacikia minuta]UBF27239.1 hypothetical protein K9N68_04545 [Kovacikia minuta CCNUW1]